jgi:hypothetical protein
MAKLHLKVRRAHVAILHQNFWKWTSGSCTTWTQSGCPLQQRWFIFWSYLWMGCLELHSFSTVTLLACITMLTHWRTYVTHFVTDKHALVQPSLLENGGNFVYETQFCFFCSVSLFFRQKNSNLE